MGLARTASVSSSLCDPGDGWYTMDAARVRYWAAASISRHGSHERFTTLEARMVRSLNGARAPNLRDGELAYECGGKNEQSDINLQVSLRLYQSFNT